MKTPIANMILEMHGKGIPVELIAGAVETFEEAMAALAVSTGNTVDTRTIDKRRAWDRERKRRQKQAEHSTGIPPVSTGNTVERCSIFKEVSSFQEEVVKEKKESKSARGTRIPPEFHLTDEDRLFAALLGIPPETIEAETPQFIDYWIAVPGAKGVKLNWKATWRNRMRDIKKYRDRNGQGTNNHRADTASRRATAREAHHVATMGGAALRYLQEGKSGRPIGEASGDSGSAEVFDLRKRTENGG